VILIDASASIGFQHDGRTGTDAAKAWAVEFLSQMQRGDRVAVFAVKGDIVPLIGTPTDDAAQARSALELMPQPRGTADWPAAIETAVRVLESAPNESEIVILSDAQRFGWADPAALGRWDRLAATGRRVPRIWMANVDPNRPANLPNAALLPIVANRALAAGGTEVQFRSAVRRTAPGLPVRVRLEVDGRAAGEIPVPPGSDTAEVSLVFARRFAPGSHLITLRLDPDALPGDDRQDFAIDVLPAIPVLIVDGETRSDARGFGSEFLRDALAPPRDPSPAFTVRIVRADEFIPASLDRDVAGPGTSPRVLVLANVGMLTDTQSAAVERFIVDGGGVLVAPGGRCEPREWNRAAQYWLPGWLVQPIGLETRATRPDTQTFQHPAVEMFRDELPGGLHLARFTQYWKLDPDPTSVLLGTLTSGDPFLLERTVGRGRVVMAAVPLDPSWGTNLIALPDFVRLTHELGYLLAASPSALNLAPGAALIFHPRDDEPAAPITIRLPDGMSVVVPVRAWPAVFDQVRNPGPYRLMTAGGRTTEFVVRPDPRESDLTPVSTADQAAVSQRLGGVEEVASPAGLQERRGRGPVAREVGGVLLIAALVLLAAGLWYTRRRLRARRANPC
jgi:hypothetical protein